MTTNTNLFNFTEILKEENVYHLSMFDWTLDELKEFVAFMDALASGFSANPKIHTMCDTFRWWANKYEQDLNACTMEDIDDGSMESDFWLLKVKAEDIATELVTYGYHNFFKA